VIHLVRGPAAALESHCARRAAGVEEAVWLAPPVAPRSWNGVRNLLAELARRRGRGAVEKVLARHRAAASRLLPRLAADLSAAERAAARRMTACAESHLSHNLLVQRPLFEAWAELLAELAAGTTFVVPDVARLDRASLGALRTLYRRHPRRAPDLLLGFDPRRPDPKPDGEGLIWELPAADVLQVVLGFQTLADTEVLEAEAGGGERPERGQPPEGALAASPWEDAVEAAAWGLLGRREPLDALGVERFVTAIQAAFGRFAFTASLHLGLGLLASEASLTPEQTAEVHGLVALAAHNRQFRSLGNRRLAELLEGHLRAAWERETRPARRSALAYRLAVTVGRRRKEPEAALEWATRSVDEARRDGIERRQAAHLEAWGRNIRAYCWMETGRSAAAVEDCETAFALLDDVVRAETGETDRAAANAATAPEPLVREIAFTHALLADNLAALAEMEGDDEAFVRWKEIGESPAEGVPGLVRFEGLSWVRFHRRRGRLDLALPRALAALEAAHAEQDALREYRYAVQAADLLDRLGRSAEALELFRRARELRSRLGDPAFLRPVTAAEAAAARRAGRLDEARARLEEALAETESPARAELLAALGEVAAAADDGAEAERRIGEAVEEAVAGGARDVLLRVAVAAGEASQVLGRRDEAREAYGRALDLVGSTGEEPDLEAQPPPAADLLAVRLGLAETSPEPPTCDDLRQLLALLPEALDDADTWARIPRLVSLVRRAETSGVDLDPLEVESLLAALERAASQRGEEAPFTRPAAPPSG